MIIYEILYKLDDGSESLLSVTKDKSYIDIYHMKFNKDKILVNEYVIADYMELSFTHYLLFGKHGGNLNESLCSIFEICPR
jgi:hypothetical protein